MSVRLWRYQWQTLALVAAILAVGAVGRAADDAAEARMRKDVTYLASDECEGRGPGTKGINLAADYVANEFKKAGLKPGGADGSYFQPFKMAGTARLESPNVLKLHGPLGQEIELAIDKHFRPLGLSGTGSTRKVPIVFVGYGATVKDFYNDYKGVDVDGKIVLVLRRTPGFDNEYLSADSKFTGQHAALQTKMVNALMNKAAAVLFVNDRLSAAKDGDPLMPFAYTASASGGTRLPALHVRRSVADEMVQSALGTSLEDLERDIERDLKPRSARFTGWQGTLEVNVSRPALAVKNVVGVLEGHGPLAKQTLVFGAHYDHLGYGGPSSLARGSTAIHHGADDNGSGTTMLLELARRYAQQGKNPRRLVFIAFSGEESGLLGSIHYCKEPLFPLVDTVAMINMDMVGRLRPDKKNPQKDSLEVWGTGTAKTFDKLIDTLNDKYNFQIKKVPSGGGPSDHASFYAKNIPVFFFFTGDHPDYHRPSDTADKINITGMRRIAGLVEELGTQLATGEERPQYVKVAGGAGRGSRGGDMPKLGIQPGYAEEGDGVAVQGVVGGGAAEKAGIKEGDRIVAIGGKPVKNIQVYMAVMQLQKKGVPLEVGVLRDGKTLTLKVTPQ